jgi:hypothetical protein
MLTYELHLTEMDQNWTHLTSSVYISGSHGSEHEEDCLLGCCALMMEAENTSETSVNFYQTTRRSIPDDSHLQAQCGIHFMHLIQQYHANCCSYQTRTPNVCELPFVSSFANRGIWFYEFVVFICVHKERKTSAFAGGRVAHPKPVF